ncbi:MAG: FecR domain-containing protein, partial [bacterium]|nr:FecR domain-containing protein [bacterium]
MVKRNLAFFAGAFLALCVAFGAVAAPAEPQVSIARMSGTVEVSHPKQTGGKWQAAKQGQAIKTGWKLRTGKGGKVQLTFPKNNTVILKENSVLYVDKLDAGGGGKLLTDKGGFLVQLKNALSPGSKFEVDTPAALATVRGTEFAVLLGGKGRSGSTDAVLDSAELKSDGRKTVMDRDIVIDHLRAMGNSGEGNYIYEATSVVHSPDGSGGGAGDTGDWDPAGSPGTGENQARYWKSRGSSTISINDEKETIARRGTSVGAPKKSLAQKVFLGDGNGGGGGGAGGSDFTKRGYGVNTRSDTPLGSDRAVVVESDIDQPDMGRKYSRIKVQLHWDREGKQDDKSSCWLRVVDINRDGRPDLAIGDMDGDGLHDQIALSGGAPSPAIGARKREPPGTGISEIHVKKDQDHSSTAMQVGDLDGDGQPDVLVPGAAVDELLSVEGVAALLVDSAGNPIANEQRGVPPPLAIDNLKDIAKLIKDGLDSAKPSPGDLKGTAPAYHW